MIKRTIIIFVVLCFISVSTFASSPSNTGDLEIGLNVSMDITPLSDQQLEMSNGLGFWGCVAAAGLWTAGVIIGGKRVKDIDSLILYAAALTKLYRTMYEECNYLRW